MTVDGALEEADRAKGFGLSSGVEDTLAAEVRRLQHSLGKIAHLDYKNAGANAAYFAHKIADATLAGKF